MPDLQSEILNIAKNVVSNEIEGLNQLQDLINSDFVLITQKILRRIQQPQGCQKIIFTGVGKPYFIAQKISASLASTGIMSIPLHPVDALHGDMGRISDGDTVFFLSKSGSSLETIEFAKALKGRDVFKIAISANPKSRLVQICDTLLQIPNQKEPGPTELIPTSSALNMLALGDALVITLAKLNELSLKSFVYNHPAGSIGKSLLPIQKVMRPLNDIAWVKESATIFESLQAITHHKTGIVLVLNNDNYLLGIFTDGDLRRAIEADVNIKKTIIGKHMNSEPKTLQATQEVAEAQKTMAEFKISEIPVVLNKKVVGLISIQDII